MNRDARRAAPWRRRATESPSPVPPPSDGADGPQKRTEGDDDSVLVMVSPGQGWMRIDGQDVPIDEAPIPEDLKRIFKLMNQ